VIDQRRNPVVRRDGEKFRLELVALADVDREHLVGQPRLFQEHRDLVAVRRGPVVEIDHGAVPVVVLADAAEHPDLDAIA